MKFIYPGFLWAFAVLAIPVIIHLFNFRRFKKILFTNVRFLMDIRQTTSSKRKLKHLLVHLCRLLAFIFLVLAFAQPYFPGREKKVTTGTSAVSIYIDNSFSMSAVAREGELFESARNKAREIASSYKASDRFMLLTNDFEGRHQRLVPREDFMRLLDEIQPSPVSRKMSEVLKKQKSLLSGAGNHEKICYLISDYQVSMADPENIEPDTNLLIYPVYLKAEARENITVDSAWLENPYVQLNQPARLMIRMKSFSSQVTENATLNLKINGIQKAIGTYSMQPGASTELSLSFTPDKPGWQQAEVYITDYPLVFDDKLHLSFYVQPGVPVLAINNSIPDKDIGSVYASDSYYKLVQVGAGQIDYSTLKGYSLIVLNGLEQVSSGLEQELIKFVKEGGSLMVFPASNPDKAPAVGNLLVNLAGLHFGALNTQVLQVNSLNKESEVFANMFEKIPESLDLPKITRHYTLVRKGFADEEVLMRMENKDIFLGRYKSGKGQVYLSSAALQRESSNFSDHWSFVPFMLKIALLNSNQAELYETIGINRPVKVLLPGTGGDQTYKLRAGNFESIPEIMLRDGNPFILTNEQVKKDGIYSLSGGGSQEQLLAYNYDRSESPVRCLEPGELEERGSKYGLNVLNPEVKGLAQLIQNQDAEKGFWKLCIILALTFLIFEVFLLRFLK